MAKAKTLDDRVGLLGLLAGLWGLPVGRGLFVGRLPEGGDLSVYLSRGSHRSGPDASLARNGMSVS